MTKHLETSNQKPNFLICRQRDLVSEHSAFGLCFESAVPWHCPCLARRGARTRSPWAGVQRQLCWAAPKTHRASGYIFIYLFPGGNKLDAPQQKELSFLSANTVPNCQLLCFCPHYSQATWLQSELGSSTHWKPQFNFSVCQGPDLSSPLLWLACLLSLIRFFALGLLLAPHSFHAPANEAQWLSLALLQIGGIHSRWDLPKNKHRQRSCPFLFIHMIPSLSQPVGTSPCHWVRVRKGTDRSREIIFWLLLPLRAHNLIKHEPMLRIPRSSLPGTVSLRLCKLEETNPSYTWGLREEVEKDGMVTQEASSKNGWTFFHPNLKLPKGTRWPDLLSQCPFFSPLHIYTSLCSCKLCFSYFDDWQRACVMSGLLFIISFPAAPYGSNRGKVLNENENLEGKTKKKTFFFFK